MKRHAALLFLLMTSMPAAWAASTAADLKATIIESKVLPTDSLAVDIKPNSVVRVTTFRHEKANDDDLKIDSVLVADKLTKKDPSIKEVQVYFFDKTSNQYRHIAVKADRVKAFGQNKITKATLLSELVVDIENGPSASQNNKLPTKKDLIFDMIDELEKVPGARVQALESFKNRFNALPRNERTSPQGRRLRMQIQSFLIEEYARLGKPVPAILKEGLFDGEHPVPGTEKGAGMGPGGQYQGGFQRPPGVSDEAILAPGQRQARPRYGQGRNFNGPGYGEQQGFGPGQGERGQGFGNGRGQGFGNGQGPGFGSYPGNGQNYPGQGDRPDRQRPGDGDGPQGFPPNGQGPDFSGNGPPGRRPNGPPPDGPPEGPPNGRPGNQDER